MCIRDRSGNRPALPRRDPAGRRRQGGAFLLHVRAEILLHDCLLYTSDAADERSSVDLGGRRIIKQKKLNYDAEGV